MKKRALLLTVCAFLALLFYSLISATNGSLLSNMIQHYGLTEAQQGLPSSALYMGCLAALMLNLFLIGRIPKARLLMITVICAVVLMFPLWLMPPFTVFWLIFGVVGVMVGTIDNLSSAIIGDLHQGKSGTRMMSTLHATFGMGGIVGPLIYQAVLDWGIGWNYVYLGLFILGLIFLNFAIPVCRRGLVLEQNTKKRGQPITWQEIKRFFSSKKRVMALLSLFTYSVFVIGITTWGKRYIQMELGSEQIGALASSLFWLGITAGRLLMSVVPIPSRQFLRWGQLLCGIVLLIGIFSQNAVVMCVCFTVAAVCSGAVVPQSMVLACSDYAHNTMLATTIFFLGLNAGQSLAPILAGAISSAAGNQVAMIFFACCVILASGFAFFIPKDQEA